MDAIAKRTILAKLTFPNIIHFTCSNWSVSMTFMPARLKADKVCLELKGLALNFDAVNDHRFHGAVIGSSFNGSDFLNDIDTFYNFSEYGVPVV